MNGIPERQLTEAQYIAWRNKMIEEYKAMDKKYGRPERKNYTLSCDTCGARFSCEFSGDMYNLDGDCLAEK